MPDDLPPTAPRANAALEPVFLRARERDPRGHVAHAWAAAAGAMLMTGPTSAAEFALGPVIVMYVLRSWALGPAFVRTLASPLPILVLAFAGWLSLGLLWTDAPVRTAIDEPGNLRWCVALLMFAPVMDRRGLIIAGLVVGLVLGQVTQVWHALGFALGFATPFDRVPVRLSGWWDPAVAGGVLTAALGLQLPTALMGSGRARWAAIGLGAAAAVGLAATGSRGGWLASAALVAVALVVAVRTGRGRTAALVCLVAGGLAVAVAAATPAVRDRVGDAVRETRAAVEAGDYQSDTGARIGMLVWAGRAFAHSPLIGVGTAGYAEWARAESGDPELPVHDHAHNTWAHLGACNGVIGVGLFAAVLGVGIAGGVRRARGGVGTPAAGPVFALIGLVFFSMFDTLHASQQTAALLAVLLALCAPDGRSIDAVGNQS